MSHEIIGYRNAWAIGGQRRLRGREEKTNEDYDNFNSASKIQIFKVFYFTMFVTVE